MYTVKSYWDMRKIPLPKDKLFFFHGGYIIMYQDQELT